MCLGLSRAQRPQPAASQQPALFVFLQAGLSVVLSDTLLKRFPNMQLGSGMSHFAAVRDQVQGAEDVNYIKLAQR